jgi:hypothetical protein
MMRSWLLAVITVTSLQGCAGNSSSPRFETLPLRIFQKPTVISYEKDGTGGRRAEKQVLRCTRSGETWDSGDISGNGLRKVFVKAGETDLRIGTAASGGIRRMLYGDQTIDLEILKANQGKDFGSPANITIICTGAGSYYVHIEWQVCNSPCL